MSLPTTPPTGTKDRYPDEFQVRNYIFQTWRTVCEQFGYQEYLAPLVENADIYRAKSGEDVGGSELTLLTDREGNVSNIALRPEMTPSVTRMVAANYNQMPKPVRYFSVANFYRNEKPQRGRNREFRQLNIDMFGSMSIQADVEILQIALSIMKAFNAPAHSRSLKLNHRMLIEVVLQEVGVAHDQQTQVVRLMDKWAKMDQKAMNMALHECGLNDQQIDLVGHYMMSKKITDLQDILSNITDNQGYQDLVMLTKQLAQLGYTNVHFSPEVIRGFDYYDGMVFEVFDHHPDNRRALFGGGRYNGLGGIFGVKDMSAVGFAPGDESTKLFLESRGLIDQIKKLTDKDVWYLPLLEEKLLDETATLARTLRAQGHRVLQGLERQKFGKALGSADKYGCTYTVIYGEYEHRDGIYKLKNMKTGEEHSIDIIN